MDGTNWKQKWENLKNDAKRKYYQTVDWCKDNKEASIVLGTVLVKGTVEMIKITSRSGRIREEQRLKDRYIYDHSSGHYYELRRKLRSSEWVEIDLRKRNGESLGAILRDMRVLK